MVVNLYNLIGSSVLFISFLILFVFVLRLLLKKSFQHAHIYQNLEPKDFDLSSDEIFIQTSNKKKVQLYKMGTQNKAPLVICIHGWENTVEKFLPLCQHFVQSGYRVVLLNTRNHGMSDEEDPNKNYRRSRPFIIA
jgi:predicted alpha/beta-fold hydrolase